MLKNSLNSTLYDELLFKILNSGLNSHKKDLDLSLSQSIFKVLPPKSVDILLRTSLNIGKDYLEPTSNESIKSTNIFFSNLEEAKKSFSNLFVIKALPTYLGKNLKNHCIVDLGYFGSVVINSSGFILNPEFHLLEQILRPMVDYMLSADLWAQNGKWERIDGELVNLFLKKNLLHNDYQKIQPCFFSLKSEVEIVEKFGIKGSKESNSYDLYLPWNFSYSDLDFIRNIIDREF